MKPVINIHDASGSYPDLSRQVFTLTNHVYDTVFRVKDSSQMELRTSTESDLLDGNFDKRRIAFRTFCKTFYNHPDAWGVGCYDGYYQKFDEMMGGFDIFTNLYD